MGATPPPAVAQNSSPLPFGMIKTYVANTHSEQVKPSAQRPPAYSRSALARRNAAHINPPAITIRNRLPKNVKPKDRRKVAIPSDLRESLAEVVELLREAKRNGEPAIDYDDAIQIGSLCGGRVGSKMRPYVFSYTPAGRAPERWALNLHRTEINDIADGLMTEILMDCCTAHDCSNQFRETGESCTHCDYENDTAD